MTTLDKDILSTIFMVPKEDCVSVCVCVCVCVLEIQKKVSLLSPIKI